ncbi:hypothetical protein CEXT_434271 [Caerostris extrusa]|uniref:Uncharacterized protein n=1 Tax=Caerostris extrusa TaxID=172846 RepID=A0AAV4Y1J2_CAEEX|nr:hypothetical protein CEXT_434271 [Caerostris extrusa]
MECKKLPSFQLITKEDADNRISELTNIYVTCLQESSTPKFKPPPIDLDFLNILKMLLNLGIITVVGGKGQEILSSYDFITAL